MTHAQAAAALAMLAASAHAASPPVLTRTEPKDWTIHYEVVLTVPRDSVPIPYRSRYQLVGDVAGFRFKSADIYFPVPRETASSTTQTKDPYFTGAAQLDGVDIANPAALLRGDDAVGDYLLLAIPPAPQLRTGGQINLTGDARPWHGGARLRLYAEIPVISHETRYDQDRAERIAWPARPLPATLQACLRPEPLIESDNPRIVALLAEWMNAAPVPASPALLAKFLTGRVVERYMPVTLGYEFNTVGQPEGLTLTGAAAIADADRADPFDIACLHVAVLRAAGIPARVIIGLDPIETTLRRFPMLRMWTEFCLVDETDDTAEWIPVDVVAQRLFSSRPPPLHQRWQHFGYSESLDDLVPLAHSFMPAASVCGPTVAYGSPALWGWRPQPDIPEVEQSIRAWAGRSVKRGRP